MHSVVNQITLQLLQGTHSGFILSHSKEGRVEPGQVVLEKVAALNVGLIRILAQVCATRFHLQVLHVQFLF